MSDRRSPLVSDPGTDFWHPAGSSGEPRNSGDVPVVAITGLADLGHYQHCLRLHLDPPPVPIEFFDDPAHAPDCPLRSPTTDREGQE